MNHEYQYRLPKPEYSLWSMIKYSAIRIIVYPILFWDLVKFVMNKLAAKKISAYLLPAQHHAHADLEIEQEHLARQDIENNESEKKIISTNALFYKKYQIVIHGKVELDTIQIEHPSQTLKQHPKYIVYFAAGDQCYERTFHELQNNANRLKINVVAFNFRGVGSSKGEAKTKDDLVIDGIAQVQRLLDQGILPENITLKGDKLGAAISFLVAEHFHKLGKAIYILNSETLSIFRNTAINFLLKPFLRLGFAAAKWNLNTADAFKNIPENYILKLEPRSETYLETGINPSRTIKSIHQSKSTLNPSRKNKQNLFREPAESEKKTPQLTKKSRTTPGF